MAGINKKYEFKGLDTRSNKLYRGEGTASDCRNVYLDSSKNLIKRPDFATLGIPRAATGDRAIDEPTEDFVDKLPPDAVIMDTKKYEDHLLLIVGVRRSFSAGRYGYSNKFYKFFEDTGILELIPIEHEIRKDLDFGVITDLMPSSSSGKFTSAYQEGILYLMGSYADTDVIATSPASEVEAQTNNLGWMWAYDGEVITKAGVPSIFEDSVKDENSLSAAPEEYVRLLPFKLDVKGRVTFGNYSTHKTTNDLAVASKQTVTITSAEVLDNARDYQVSVEYQGAPISVTAGDTIPVDIFIRTGTSTVYSVSVGNYLYYIRKSVSNIGTDYTESFDLYKMKVTEVDYGAGTITVDDLQNYDPVQLQFESVNSFNLDSNSFLSNHIIAVYGSDDYTIGFEFRGLTIYAYNDDASGAVDFTYSYNTAKAAGSNTTTSVSYFNQPLASIPEEFEDGIDEESVKLPPPRGRQVVEYLGALVVVDYKTLYFSDFSVGGTLENFTPFDNFPVGSTERGLITGVFANETFIAVFREEEAYYITGNIFLANYRIQSYQSTRIGCTSPTSIIDFQGAGLFMSKRGIYFCQQGGAMPEISDSIETIFTDNELELNLDLSNCKAVVDFRREYIYFHVASTSETSGYIIAFSYYHKEWFLWDGVNGINGFDIIDGLLYSCDGTNVYKETSTSVNSEGYYRSNFETLGEPSFMKKFLQALLFTVDAKTSHLIGFKTYRDWNTDEVATDETKQVSPSQVDVTQRFNSDRSKSLAIEINSSAGNELIVNGYEYEVDADVRMFKNDD